VTFDLYSVQFPVDAQTGYAIGWNGTIRKTTDGGTSWVRQSTGFATILKSVCFPVDAQTGYVAGYSGTVLKTTNGGTSWASQITGTTNHLTAVHFPVDARTGYLVGEWGAILVTTDGGTWVEEERAEVRGQKLKIRITATPNPFTEKTVVGYQLSSSGPVRLAVYNITGQVVKVLASVEKRAGIYRETWDGRDRSGRRVQTGIYFLRLEVGDTQAIRKVVILR